MPWRARNPRDRQYRDEMAIAEANRDRLHTLSADELHSAHLTPYLQQAQDELSSKLQSTQAENAIIFGKINEQRAEMEQLLNGLDFVITDIEGSVDAMYTDEQSGFKELKGDVWTIEQEVAAMK